jgi:hypothetical protein
MLSHLPDSKSLTLQRKWLNTIAEVVDVEPRCRLDDTVISQTEDMMACGPAYGV